MKRTLFISLLCISSVGFSQDTIRANAVSIGAKVDIASIVELAYDRILTPHTNFDISIGYGTNLTSGYTGVGFYYTGGVGFVGQTKMEIYPNGLRQNMIRFYIALGIIGNYFNNRFINGLAFGPSGSVGLAYFGKNGFHFKVENALGLQLL